MPTLRSRLTYEPQELRFGTSGRRGRVADLSQLEVYINATAELEYMQSLAPEEGGIVRGEDFHFAYDLRPSSTAFVPSQEGRGEIAQAVVAAISDAGMRPLNMGRIPSPALMHYAVACGKGSIMVTGSHIPFDRNGYKFNTSRGELRKEFEGPINERVREVRDRICGQEYDGSAFDDRGFFKSGHHDLPEERGEARAAYIERFLSFFHGESLDGMRLLVYEHSAVGRDILAEILERLGAEVIRAGRSETFVPIDTENIEAAQLEQMQLLADEAAAKHGRLDAVVSTDGDSDRPLILGIDPATAKVRFFGGDLVGMVVAEFLKADAVVVPITCNDGIDRGPLAGVLEPKTRIGSPFVIPAMEHARVKGRRCVCGWEANGGFLTGSDIERNGAILCALPTRDAVLPILAVLFSAREKHVALPELFAGLPRRFSRAALLKQFPRSAGLSMIERLSKDGARELLAEAFSPEMGFGAIAAIDYTDGVRITFDNGEVAHLRPSGNADEFRMYAVACTQERADAIAAMGISEPGGIVRRLEQALTAGRS